MPKVLPGFFKSFETVHGDGGAGTIKLITWAEGTYFLFNLKVQIVLHIHVEGTMGIIILFMDQMRLDKITTFNNS